MNKVLIVDDDRDLRNLIKSVLKFSDYEIYEAGNSNEAIEVINRVVPDVIILDIIIPGDKDGLEICQFVKGNPQISTIRIIILSGLGAKKNFKMAGVAGADAYLVKPFTTLSLLESVKCNRPI